MFSAAKFSSLWLLTLCCLTVANPIKRAKNHLQQVRGQTADDFIVTKLPGLFENVHEKDIPLMHAGQLLLEEDQNSHYFFWKFVDGDKHPDATNKTVFWFNGGPGCLSLDGALMESGPFRINDKAEVTFNKGSWHKLADVVYVDQPAGTGFSYGKTYDNSMEGVVEHFLKFLDRYYEVFPEDRENEIVIAGESYAGQYIPNFGNALLKKNERIVAGEEEGKPFNLRGLMIGNGAISGDEQSLSFVPLISKYNLMDKSHPQWPELLRVHEHCQNNINKAKAEGKISNGDRVCESILNKILQYTLDALEPHDSQCINMYDFNLRDSYPSCGMNWPAALPDVYEFLGKEESRNDLNIHYGQKWRECNGLVHSVLESGYLTPSITLFPYILEHVEIVLFWGMNDIICNYMGGEIAVKNLEWGGSRGYTDQVTEYEWINDEEVVGTIKSERNLTFINVYNSSHMVPWDKPEVSRALVNIFMKRYSVKSDDGESPQIVTKGLFGISEGGNYDSSNDESEPVSSNEKPNEEHNTESTGPMMRIIELVVIIVLIWAVCALYLRYQSKPVSIIRTEASASSGKKKNVLWAEDLESEFGEAPPTRDDSFIARAYNLIKKPEAKGNYAPVEEDGIEMRGMSVDDDFIITSDDESNDHHNRAT